MAEPFFEYPIRSDKLSTRVGVRAVIHESQTEFQQITILDTEVFGRMLLLDGHIQLTEFDERAYHEALVQIPLLNVPRPRRALVVGGGDGGVLREICRHASIEHVDIVEIDVGVIDACRTHLPNLSNGAFGDPRVDLHIGDAFAFVQADREPYDLIVVDCTDVYEDEEGGLSEMLFTEGFYQDCRRLLSSDGFLVSQADNLVFCPYSLEAIRNAFGSVFPGVGSYQALVPSFGGFSGYCWASQGPDVATTWSTVPNPAAFELRYLNAATYALAFHELRF
ncbi:MAG TPA: hypothetical protein PLH94_06490 [Fimbriimonadaceae bacterium]|nr:hypothetical protein [Fimbriimonadaceae bacterium]